MSIDFRTLPVNVPILCIPRVYSNISESRIRRIFEDLEMGTLERIDMVSKQSEKGEKFNRVFVHFRKWNNSKNSCEARERLLNGKEIKIIYDEPWFWKISAYREAERKPTEVAAPKKATIQFDSSEDSPRPIHHEQRPIHHEQRPIHHEQRPRHHEQRPRHHEQRPIHHEQRPRHHEQRPRHYEEKNQKKRSDEPQVLDVDKQPESTVVNINYDANLNLPRRKIQYKKQIKLEASAKALEEGEVEE